MWDLRYFGRLVPYVLILCSYPSRPNRNPTNDLIVFVWAFQMVVLYLPLKRIRSVAPSHTAIFIPICNRLSLITAANLTKFRDINKLISVYVYPNLVFYKLSK